MTKRQKAKGKRQKEESRRFALLLPFSFFLLPSLLGCGRSSAEPVRLILLSPHRDEIRAEVGQAFQEWFGQRTSARAMAARQAVASWLHSPGAAERAAADAALSALLEDWRPDEPGELRAAYNAWRAESTPTHGQALLEALDQWRQPPVEVVWQDLGGTSQITRYVEARFKDNPAGIGVDLVFGGGTDQFLRFAKAERLEPVTMPAALLARIPQQLNGNPLYDPQGRWYGPMLSSFGILYNRGVLERLGLPEPGQGSAAKGWDYLAQPNLGGWVSAGDPRQTGSVHMVYEIILQSRSWDEGFRLLMRLGANTHSFIRDSGTLTRMVTSGEVAAAGNVDANALTAVGLDPAILGYYLPPGETIINADAIAVLKGAPHAGLARAFVEFTLSDAGQRLLLLRPGLPGGPRRYPVCRLSVVPALYRQYPPAERSVGNANPFEIHSSVPYDSKLGFARSDALNDLFGAWVVDAHPELAEAWRAVCQGPLPPEERANLTRELFEPPLKNKEELTAYAERIEHASPRERTETINRWGAEARQRYRDIRRACGTP